MISDKLQQKIVSQIESVLRIQPSLTVHEFGGDEFLEIKVPKSNVPVDKRGVFYKRVGNTTRRIDREGLKDLLFHDVVWDSIIRTDTTQFDLNHSHIVPFALQAQQKFQLGNSEHLDTQEFLTKTGLVSSDKITNAALLIFGKNTQAFPFAKLRVGRFKSDTIIVADHIIEGNLTNQIAKSEQIIRSLLNRKYKITSSSFKREEYWEYPLEAIREAILNAVVHRDYRISGSFIEVKIYENYMLVSSPGRLPEGITIDQLSEPHQSVRRNPLIAETFFRGGYIEQFGTGTLRMKESLKAIGHPEPVFSEEGNSFVVRFDAAIEPINPKNFNLNDRQLKAIELSSKGKIQASDLHQFFPEVSRKTITRDLAELVELALFVKSGKGKGTRYEQG